MSRFTEREHAWFRGRLPDHLLDLLADDDRTRFDAHARACPACARLLQSAQGARADWWDGAGHVPVGALLAWDPDAAGSRRHVLVRAHLEHCESCRRDLADLRGDAALAAVPAPAAARRASRPRASWVPAFGGAAAVTAAIVAVWVLGRPAEPGRPAEGAAPPPAAVAPPTASAPSVATPPSAPAVAEVVIAAATRGESAPPQRVTLPVGATRLRVTLPALDVADDVSLTVELLGADGATLARHVAPAARALRPGGVELSAPPAGRCTLLVRWLDPVTGESVRDYALEVSPAR